MTGPKKKLVVLSGAGVSAESGISTFRDNGGLWDKYDPMVVASIEGWQSNPDLLTDFYNVRRQELRDVKPNGAHLDIAALQDGYDVTVITQNVDNLHERAGSSKVLHLHGELTKVRPENTYCDEDGFSEKNVFDIGYGTVSHGERGVNGALLRPHIVFFGEAVPNIGKAADIMMTADIVLIVGTSLKVYPAAGLYRYAPYESDIYIIDPNEVLVKDPRLKYIRAKATDGMKIFLEKLSEKGE